MSTITELMHNTSLDMLVSIYKYSYQHHSHDYSVLFCGGSPHNNKNCNMIRAILTKKASGEAFSEYLEMVGELGGAHYESLNNKPFTARDWAFVKRNSHVLDMQDFFIENSLNNRIYDAAETSNTYKDEQYEGKEEEEQEDILNDIKKEAEDELFETLLKKRSNGKLGSENKVELVLMNQIKNSNNHT